MSCRQSLSKDDNIHQSHIVRELGGYNDTITDMFGVNIDICNLEDGLDRVLRRSILRHAITAHRQPLWVPAFTKVKMKLIFKQFRDKLNDN